VRKFLRRYGRNIQWTEDIADDPVFGLCVMRNIGEHDSTQTEQQGKDKRKAYAGCATGVFVEFKKKVKCHIDSAFVSWDVLLKNAGSSGEAAERNPAASTI
jgi:hypothetical protein